MERLYTVWLLLMCLRMYYSSPLKYWQKRVKDQEKFAGIYRLDATVLPTYYEIKLTTYLQENEVHNKTQFTFEGNVQITIMPTVDKDKITLHSSDLTFNENPTVKWSGNRTDDITVIYVLVNEKTEKVTLILSRNIPAGFYFNLTFDYEGKMNKDMVGFYRSKYKRKDGYDSWIGATQFQPVYARRVFPCFDEPQFKAHFQITINHHKNYTADSNTFKIKELVDDPREKDRVLTKFEATPKMSTYLVAFVVSDLKSFGDEKNITILAREDVQPQTTYALDIGQKLLKKMEEFISLTYVELGNSKMQFVALSDLYPSTMENWGLITFQESALLYDSQETSKKDKQHITSTIVNGQARTWFGNYITCVWWNVTWLNEGFATFFEYLIPNEIDPTWELDKQIIHIMHVSFKPDSYVGVGPITNKNVGSQSQIIGMFDILSYYKGASIIRMIQHMIGEEHFKKALQAYVNNPKLRFNTTLPEDLFEAFKSKWNNNKINLDDIKADWTEQEGYPLITVDLGNDLKTFNVSQKRFILKKSVENSDLKYTIPFTYATSKNVSFESTQPDLFLTKNKERVTVNLNEPVDWIVANKLQTGYYRVNYNDKGWELIHHALGKDDFDKIHEMNRAQIVDDLFNFGRSGDQPYDRVLHMLEYLNKETNYLPWHAAQRGFEFLLNRVDKNDYNHLKNYTIKLLLPSYKKFGFEEKHDDKTLDIYNRELILKLACDLGYHDCVKKSIYYFENLKNHQTPIPVNIRSVVYCTAICVGTESDFEFLWDKYKNSQVATERKVILRSLGCAFSKTFTTKYLRLISSPEVRSQDKQMAFVSNYVNKKKNVPLIFNYIESNLDELIDVFGIGNVFSIITDIASYFTTQDRKIQLEKFWKYNKHKFGVYSETFVIVSDIIDDNIAWYKNKLPSLNKYFKENHKKNDAYQSISFNFMLQIFSTIFSLQNF